MGPQREAAIRFLTAQVAKYRADLTLWRHRAGRTGAGLVQSRIIAPLQDLIEDGSQLLARLRCRLGGSGEGSADDKERAAPSEKQDS